MRRQDLQQADLSQADALFDQGLDFVKRVRIRTAQPLKQDHFGGHQLGACPGQPVKCRVAVAFGA